MRAYFRELEMQETVVCLICNFVEGSISHGVRMRYCSMGLLNDGSESISEEAWAD
jgi:hypothetical protein